MSASFFRSRRFRFAILCLAPIGLIAPGSFAAGPAASPSAADTAGQKATVTGQAAFADWNQQQPGIRRKITLADLPEPKPDEAVDNTPHVVPRPADAWPQAPAGFKVTLYAGGDSAPMQRADNKEHMARSNGTFTMPRLIRTAPNGDLFLADSGAGTIFILRGIGANGKAATDREIRDRPRPSLRHRLLSRGKSEVGLCRQCHDDPALPIQFRRPARHGSARPSCQTPRLRPARGGGHWTRDVVFTKDGQQMLISVGSGSNVDDPDTHPGEFHRADVLEYTPKASSLKSTPTAFATASARPSTPSPASSGARPTSATASAITWFPTTSPPSKKAASTAGPGTTWAATRTRACLSPAPTAPAPNLQAAALTADQAQNCKRVNLASKVLTPDVLVQPHMASLEMTFYPESGSSFPKEYDGDGFAAEHGSWNRKNRAGYEVIRIPMRNGHADRQL
jgi:glucose/arabinose dehydrogenase